MLAIGAYPADRAAALSGVPLSTVHYWARREILLPSVSAERVKLWSYADLLALRTIYWLRHEKTVAGGEIPRSSMPAIRKALRALRRLDLDLYSDEGESHVLTDRAGKLYIRHAGGVQTPEGQQTLVVLDLISPFETAEGLRGPDLRRPRPHLRIVPAKLGGSPHVLGTRVETMSIGALALRGLDTERIHKLYPFVEPVAIEEAVDLERQLGQNLAIAA